MRLLEEAMAAASAGRVRNVHTLGEAYCNLITACANAGEWERATEWCEQVDDFAREHDADAAASARAARSTRTCCSPRAAGPRPSRRCESALAAHARHYVPGDGRPDRSPRWPSCASARAACRRPSSCSPVARSTRRRCARSRSCASPRAARRWPPRCSSAAWRRPATTRCASTQLLAPLVDARLACRRRRGRGGGDGRARRAGPQLGQRLLARPRRPRRRARGARRRASEAAEPARRALAEFSRLAMPLDAGEARLALARALAADAPELARDEASTAFASFQELGASRAVDAAAAVLRELGAGTARRARARTASSPRASSEVLGLLGAGHVERAHRADAVHQREDGGPPRQPHPLQARRQQPRRGRRPRGARRARRPPAR